MILAKSSAFSVISSPHFLRMTDLSFAVVSFQVWKAVLASSTAFLVSETEHFGTLPIISREAGLFTSRVSPEELSTHSPFIKHFCLKSDLLFNSICFNYNA